MKEMKLIVGSVSSWSMRAWLCLKMADIPFSERVIPLGAPGYKEALAALSNTMLVPVLDTGTTKIHDSLAIAEYCNELAAGRLLPEDQQHRALCRSLSCELHAGFINIRRVCPFSWDKQSLANVDTNLQAELDRLENIWGQAGGGYYFGSPSIVDAFYSVMAYRLATYGVEFGGSAGEYQTHLLEWPLFTEMLEAAKKWA